MSSRSRVARTTWGSMSNGRPSASDSTSSGRTRTASAMQSRIGVDGLDAVSMSRLSRNSMAWAKSPTWSAPTSRPLPLSVWKLRRSVASASASDGSDCQRANWVRAESISSRASSRKMSRNSVSPSSDSRSDSSAGRVGSGSGSGSSGSSSAGSGRSASMNGSGVAAAPGASGTAGGSPSSPSSAWSAEMPRPARSIRVSPSGIGCCRWPI